MNLQKILIFCFVFFLTLNITYSVCVDGLEDIEIEVYSGSSYVGKYDANNILESIYIKPKLNQQNLRLKFIFNNNEDYCIPLSDNFGFYLYPGSFKEYPHTLTENFAEFNFDYGVELQGNFQAKYTILSDGNNIEGTIPFSVDSSPPKIDINPEETNLILREGSFINIDLTILDDKSGLDSVSITGENIEFYNGSTFPEIRTISETLNFSKNFEIIAKDLLGNENKKTINITIDSNPPQIIKTNNNYFNKIYKSDGSKNYVEFSNIIITDDFFKEGEDPYIYGNFESINSEKSNVKLNCVKNENLSNSFICTSSQIEIKQFSSTKNVDISFTLRDGLNNEGTIEITGEEIFVDNKGPEVDIFELVNSLGVKNLLSFRDNSSYVHLIFEDESYEKIENPTIYIEESFYWINNPQELVRYNGCLSITDVRYECYWDLKNSVLYYQEFLHNEITYNVILGDSYGNFNQFRFNVTIDNVNPKIVDTQVEINEGIQTGIIKSGDKIDIKVFVKDNNLENSGEYFVDGSFASISSKSPHREAHCFPYNTTTYECDFNNIEVKNGYLKKNVTITVSDAAGNIETEKIEIEVFKKGEEVPSAYHIEDLNEFNQKNLSGGISTNYSNLLILNPIAREDIVNCENCQVSAWFEGKLSLDNNSSNYELVNYDLNCPASFLFKDDDEIVSVARISLYPDGPIYYQEKGDEIFAIRVDLEKYENAVDLNNMSLNCNMSVLKKDDDTIYGLNHDESEQVPFNMSFTFRGDLKEDLLNSRAENMLEMINEIDGIGNSYDDIYSLYQVLKGVCTTVSAAQSLLVGVSNVVYGTQWILSPLIPLDGGDRAGKIGKTGYDPTAYLGGELFASGEGVAGGINTMCKYVTCEISGDLLSLSFGDKNERVFLKMLEDINRNLCPISNELADKNVKVKNNDIDLEE